MRWKPRRWQTGSQSNNATAASRCGLVPRIMMIVITLDLGPQQQGVLGVLLRALAVLQVGRRGSLLCGQSYLNLIQPLSYCHFLVRRSSNFLDQKSLPPCSRVGSNPGTTERHCMQVSCLAHGQWQDFLLDVKRGVRGMKLPGVWWRTTPASHVIFNNPRAVHQVGNNARRRMGCT